MSRVLLVSPNAPYPTDMGAAQRTFLLFESLRRCSEVDLLIVSDDVLAEEVLGVLRSRFNLVGQVRRTDPKWPDGESLFRLPRVGTPLRWAWRLWRGADQTLAPRRHLSQALAKVLAQRDYRAVVTRYLWPACQSEAFAHRPVFVDFDDLESEVLMSQATVAQGLGKRSASLWRRLSAVYRKRERREVVRCAGAWVTKSQDVYALDGPRVRVLPNIPFSAYPSGTSPLGPPSPDDCVVLGVAAFDWPPNRTGFDWFATVVWPKVLAAVPQARLHLVGKSSDVDLVARWSELPGVRYLGRVDDLRACYAQALFTVAPLFMGGGTNIKVIESLALGRCCVLSTHASKGFDALPGLHVAGDAHDFADRCRHLLLNRSEALALGREAAAVVGPRYAFDGFAAVVSGTVNEHSCEGDI